MASQSGLFGRLCAEKCDLYHLCGGSVAAPCGCVYTDERQFDCDQCLIWCTARRTEGYSLEKQLSEGSALTSITVTQTRLINFPLLIPLATDELTFPADVSCGAADTKGLLTNPKHRAASPRQRLLDQLGIRHHLRVRSSTDLIAILNSVDGRLERFWAMGEEGRGKFFGLLAEQGFAAVTGPTFSVTDEESGFTASHNVFMQRRHHRVLQEIQESGLIAIPNLYFRNDSDLAEWVQWIVDNGITTVSVDFSRSKPTRAFAQRLAEVLRLLYAVDRAVHVLLVGVSLKNGLIALKQLVRINCTGSIITSDPIRTAISGGAMFQLEADKVVRVQRLDLEKQVLVRANIKFSEQYLRSELDKFIKSVTEPIAKAGWV